MGSQDAPVEAITSEDRKLRAVDDELLAKVDRLLALTNKLDAMKGEYKRNIAGLEQSIDGLKKELLDYGKETQTGSISSRTATVEFTSRVSRKIDPKAFLTFLSLHNKTKTFYDFVDVPLTGAIKHFGEAVLESSGVLTSNVRDYAGVKVRPI